MAKTIKQLQPHKFSAGDTVKVVSAGRTEWCKIGDTHTIRICKHDQKGEPVYVVDFDKDDSWIRECNLELVERDRQKGGEWKRHRAGRKQPVPDRTRIEVKFRDGEIHTVMSDRVDWVHYGHGSDLMQYRVISQPQAEEVGARKLTQDLNMKTPQGEFVRGPISLGDEIIYPAEAKRDRVDGPLLWRDTVNELDAYIEEFTRERDALIERLASEGFALIPPVVGVVSEFSGVDMSDWRNWKDGDKIRMTADDWCDLSKGEVYEIIEKGRNYITILDDVDYRRKLDIDGETMFEDGRLLDFEFVSRP